MNKLENKLSSREVADMMEVQHKDLLKKIDGINEDFKSEKIRCSKYWIEGTYKQSGNGKLNREFMITKRGCEFLAHKQTGTKGNLFTDRYMDKFAEMEKFISEGPQRRLTPMEMMELQFQISKEQAEKIEAVDNKISKLENDMPLFNVDCKELQSKVKKIGTQILGGYKSQAYNDNSLRGRVYADIHHQVRREFGVDRYEAIKRSQLDKAMEIVSSYKAPMVLIEAIEQTNNQLILEDVM